MQEAWGSARCSSGQDSTHPRARQACCELPWEVVDRPSRGRGERARVSGVCTSARLRGSTLRPRRDALVVQGGHATSRRGAVDS
jgi:hypothetical protein